MNYDEGAKGSIIQFNALFRGLSQGGNISFLGNISRVRSSSIGNISYFGNISGNISLHVNIGPILYNIVIIAKYYYYLFF